ncbi:hypothetical protein [Rhodoplanes elegans]|uniref:hypothetical protein n=1 Tax=Rhodoplanes elegans TaxID=29408 RepID=UPI001FDFEA17|nr:hypothetical protein [Rhodoplanes elegans]
MPLTIRRRRCRKLIIVPVAAPGSRPPAPSEQARSPATSAGHASWNSSSAPVSYTNAAIVKALARAYRWRHMLENGESHSITAIARAEKVNESYACRVLRLTLLAPEIVEAILSGTAEFSLAYFMRPLPATWAKQAELFLPNFRDQAV